ncbi:MAG: glycine cleavage system aminomethyltransferase GcvT [Burkholderiales bacterium]
MKQTPLTALHRAAGAKMVDFGGWEMPLHYGSQLDEHRRVRDDAGVFDVSHMLAIDVPDGRDGVAGSFLRRMLASDIDRLTPGKAFYTCLLNADGGIIDDLIVYALADRFRLVVNAGCADKDLAWLEQHRTPRLQIEARRDLAILALQGPNASTRLGAALPGLASTASALKPFTVARFANTTIARTGYTGEDGFEIMPPASEAGPYWQVLVAAGAAPIGLGARDTLRLEAGMLLYGQDMDETVTPFEAGCGCCVHLDGEGDFIGRDALRSRAPVFQTLGLVLLDKGVLRSHQKVNAASGEGEVVSGGFAPTLNRSIALARLPLTAKPGDIVDVDVRGKLLRAEVVKPPFARNGKSRIT